MDRWLNLDYVQLQQLVQRMRAFRESDAKLIREIENLNREGGDSPSDGRLQHELHPCGHRDD